MKKSTVLAAALFVLWGGVAHALPIKQTDYLSSEEEHFRAADTNKTGYIEREEAKAAFTNVELMPDENARKACNKAGRDLNVEYGISVDEKNYRSVNFEQYMTARKNLFDHIDLNHDHIIVKEEMEAFSAEVLKMCSVAPQTMEDLKLLQGSDKFKKMTPEQRNQMLQRLRTLQGKE